jgi:mRNA interferase MazF
MITSADNESWSCDVNVSDLERAGLPSPSVVRPAKVACIDVARILRRAGKVDPTTEQKVSETVRSFLPN